VHHYENVIGRGVRNSAALIMSTLKMEAYVPSNRS
jgi:hypothetical protein